MGKAISHYYPALKREEEAIVKGDLVPLSAYQPAQENSERLLYRPGEEEGLKTREETLRARKVVWPNIASSLDDAVVSAVENKVIIPQHTITLVACESEEEDHYLCAIINSRIVNFLAKSCSQAGGKSFGDPYILNHIRIPLFDVSNPVHKELANLSMEAHRCAQEGEEELFQ